MALALSSTFQHTLTHTLAFCDEGAFPMSKSLGQLLVNLFAVQRDWSHPFILIAFGTSLLLALSLSALPSVRLATLRRRASTLAIVGSCVSWLLLFLKDGRASGTAMGRMLCADLALVVMLQLYMFAVGTLPLASVFVGPLGACALARNATLRFTPGSVTRCLAFVALLLPAIYRENGRTQSVHDLLAARRPLELYACVQICAMVLYLILMSSPTTRGGEWRRVALNGASLFALVACANHNVAAAWALIAM